MYIATVDNGYIKLPDDILKKNENARFYIFRDKDMIYLKKINNTRITDNVDDNEDADIESINKEIEEYRKSKK